eukprot:scaffold36270_cov163-Isochrysis_galbana.AAC.1
MGVSCLVLEAAVRRARASCLVLEAAVRRARAYSVQHRCPPVLACGCMRMLASRSRSARTRRLLGLGTRRADAKSDRGAEANAAETAEL